VKYNVLLNILRRWQKEMKAHYRVGSFFWLMIGVITLIGAYQLGIGSLRKPGPGFIFLFAASILVVFSIFDLLRTFFEQSADKEEEPIWSVVRWQKVLLVLGSLIAYAYFLDFAGFFLSTFLLMLLLFKVVEPTRWWIAIVGSLITILISYGLFKLWLQVPFPTGSLWF
jgi:putative tricarboxylic transport membrane protein